MKKNDNTLSAAEARQKMIKRQSGEKDAKTALRLNPNSADKTINARNLPHGDSLGWPKGDYRR